MRRLTKLAVLTIAALLLLAAPAFADVKEVPRVSCTPPASGGTVSEVRIQRAPAPVSASSVWTDLFTLALPSTNPQTVDDVNRPNNVAIQHRCLYTGPGGATPTQPSIARTFVDIAAPGEGKVQVIIITVPAN
jgi:hypothetical protein